MSEELKRAIQHAVARTEPRRVAAIHQKTPGALGESPRTPQPVVKEHEIRERCIALAEAAKSRNLPVCPMEIEARVRVWLRTEEILRLQQEVDRLHRGDPPTDP